MQPFRNFGAALAIFSLLSPILAQQKTKPRPSQPKPKATESPAKKPAAAKPNPQPTPTPTPDPAVESERFDAAIATDAAIEKAELLVKFIADFPKSENRTRAEESLAGARAAIADERLSAGDLPGAMRLFRVVIEDAPKPYSDRLYNGIIATIPANLWVRGHRSEGFEIARLIESHIATDANKLLLLSTFYLGSENGHEAKRIAESAITLDEKNATAHQTLASAQRLNFDLESAAASFTTAVELDPESTVSKRSLADLKRAIGKADEAEAIYRSILATNEKDNQARTGLVLSLFDQGKRSDAEAEMSKALAEAPGNVVLLAGAAYWYAANKDGDKAVEYAQRAIDKEPRYIWSHIALGRGLMLQGKPVEAEQALMAARKYGNFPTLQYEIASARFAAGFFREAAEELKKSFLIEDGTVKTRLGGRIETMADSFTAAIANERRASIFTPTAADNADDAARLKALVEMSDNIARETRDIPAIVTAAEAFASGGDNMAVHRKLYAANLLLQNDLASEAALKFSSDAVAGLDKSLDVPNPGAAVMASELYEARAVSFARDGFLLIPDVPKQTLTALMRGRIEETTGLALLRQGKAEEASVRFRRALTVLPKDSAWWRSATWNLGTSLAAEGKDKEALDTMISSYIIDKPNITRYIIIEQLWTKVNGSREGFEDKLGPNPLPNFTAAVKPEPTPEASSTPAAEPSALTDGKTVSAETSPISEVSPSPVIQPDEPKSSPSPGVSPNPETLPSPEATPTPESSPTPATELKGDASPTPEASPSADVVPPPVASPSPELSPTLETSPSPVPIDVAPMSSPTPDPSPELMNVALGRSPELSPTPSESTDGKATDTATRKEPRKLGSPLFDPIVITIPRPASEKKTAATEQSPNDTKPTDDAKNIPEGPPATEPARPRVIEGKAITGELLPCEIGVSQESVSLVNNGGSIALLVTIEQGEDIKLVYGTPSSPDDIEVRAEPDIVELAGRAMFVIRSVSEKTGLYQVTFKAPCGKRAINVRVR